MTESKHDIHVFVYPYKLYIVGACIYVLFVIYGLQAVPGDMYIKLIYFSLCSLPLYWYYSRYKFYKKDFYIIHADKLIVSQSGNEIEVTKENLKFIYTCQLFYKFKMHPLVVIVLVDDRYFIISYELDRYKVFKEALSLVFKEFYHVGGDFVKDLKKELDRINDEVTK